MVPRALGGDTLELARQLPAPEGLARHSPASFLWEPLAWAWVGVDAGGKVGRFLPKRTPELVGSWWTGNPAELSEGMKASSLWTDPKDSL